MTFLTGLATELIEWFATTLFTFIGKEVAQKEADDAVAAKAKADAVIVAAAKTAEEKALAARKIADDTFSN